MNTDEHRSKRIRDESGRCLFVVKPLHPYDSPQECLRLAHILGGEFREIFQDSPSRGEEGGEGFGGG